MSRPVHVAVFQDEHDLLRAVAECRRRGLTVVDAFCPYPVHGLEAALGLRRSRLPIVCFLCGLAGLAAALWLQYWTSATDWPLNVGGKPFDSLPAFVPVAFELLVLCAGLGTAFAFLARSRLFPGRAPRAPAPQLSDDRFALVIEEQGAAFSREELTHLWHQVAAVEFFAENRT